MSRTMLEHELIGWLDNARKTYGDPPIAKPLVKRALGELMRLTDELTALRAENARLKGEVEQERAEVARWKLVAFSPLGDNHHNAAQCPYCTPSLYQPKETNRDA